MEFYYAKRPKELREMDYENIAIEQLDRHSKLFHTRVAKGTCDPQWAEADILFFVATLDELLNESIVLQIFHRRKGKRDPVIAQCRLALSKYVHPARDGVLTRFREHLSDEAAQPAGKIKGLVQFKHVPRFAQMSGGLHTEVGVEGGRKRLEGLPSPRHVLQQVYDPGKGHFFENNLILIFNEMHCFLCR